MFQNFIGNRLTSYPLTTYLLDQISVRYDLGRIRKYRLIGDGRSSKTHLLISEKGNWILKQYRQEIQLTAVTFIHSLLHHLDRNQFPCVRLKYAPEGEDYVFLSGHYYAAFAYQSGYRGDWFHMLNPFRRRHIQQAAITLARYHLLTKDFKLTGHMDFGYKTFGGKDRWDDYSDYSYEWRQLADLVISENNDKAIVNQDAIDNIAAQFEIMAEEEKLRHLMPMAIIHDDYGPWNLIFNPIGVFKTLLDFDDVCLEERIEEIAASLISFAGRSNYSLNLEDGRVFLESYHSINPLEIPEIQAIPQALKRHFLKRTLRRIRRYWQTGKTEDGEKLIQIISWLSWLQTRGNSVFAKLIMPISDGGFQSN